MTEPNEAMKAMAHRIANGLLIDVVYKDARRRFVADMTGLSFDEVGIRAAAHSAALLAISETQRLDADLADDFGGATGVRIRDTIRTGNHYGKDESHD